MTSKYLKMKKVIFVCLLTLSICLSQPTKDSVNKTNTDAPNPTNIVPKDDNKTTDPPKHSAEKAANGTAEAHNETSTSPSNTTVKPENGTIVPNNDTKKNETTVKPTEAAPTQSTPTIPTTPPTKGTPSTPTTPAVPVTQSTTKPTMTTVPPPKLQARGFDGASFVGGIILTLGLLAIGFMGFRYYKTQTERNYHTL